MTNRLAELNVLITRPQGQVKELKALIEERGGRACHFPLMDIIPLDEQLDSKLIESNKQKVLLLDQYQHLIFISTNAVHFGLELIEQYWPQLPIGIKWYGIGKATSADLQQYGIKTAAIASSAMNSEALLQHPDLQHIQQQKIAIIRGVGGRDYLQQQLLQRGATVDYIECYQRRPPAREVGELEEYIEQQRINALCINSAESVSNFVTLLGTDAFLKAKTLPVVVPSQRVAQHAIDLGFEHIQVASNASNIAITETLEMIRER